MKKIIFVLLSLIAARAVALPADAGRALSDTSQKDLKSPDTVRFPSNKVGSIIPGVALVAYGGLSFVVHPIRRIDYYFKDRIAASAPNFNSRIDDYTQLAPGAAVYVLNLFGDEGKHRFWDRTALVALSGVILTIADGTKYLSHRDRPVGTSPLSFPSGHTGAAFVAAEFLSQEYSWKSPWYGIAAYTCASATAVMRMYNRAHWFSDCVAGAGLGILSTKAAYWLYPHIQRALSHKDKHGRMSTFMPNFQDGAPGFAFTMQL